MHYASVENISKSFGMRTLFKNISFHVEEGDKVALIARNGTGKTTLLNILAGLDKADNGTVWVHKDVKTLMLQQETQFDENKSIWDNILKSDNPLIKAVKEYEIFLEKEIQDDDLLTELLGKLDEVNAWNFESILKQILGKLDLHHLNEPVKNLSGGQKKRVALAQVLIDAQLHEGKCLLILDEPTNHLDVGMIEWLENFITSQKSTLLLVTHDRYFLDAVCQKIIEIDEEQIFTYKGDYDYYLEQKSLRFEAQQSELAKDKNIFRRELAWMRKQPKARTTKSKSRQDSFVDLQEKVKKNKEEEEMSLQIKMTRLGSKILEMERIDKSYGDKLLIKDFTYTFKKGERIGIVGKNGVGKSTFLKIAQQQEKPDKGEISQGETVIFGNFNQEGLAYKEDKRAIEYVKEMSEVFPLADGSSLSASQFMEKFGFSGEKQYTLLSKLSGGEKRRLHLLRILFRNPNFLILDEPTNDLDLQTLQTLEGFLMEYPGCILIVSHDRYFMDRLVDRIFAFEGNGVIKDFPGNYTQYRIWKDEQETKKQAPKANIEVHNKKNEVNTSAADISKPKLSYNEKQEFEKLEKELKNLEQEKNSLEEKISQATISFEEIQKASNRVGEIMQLLDQKELRWLELSERG